MLADLLQDFERFQNGPVPWSFVHQGGIHERCVVVGSMVHGNEVGSLPAVLRLADALRSGELRYGGRLALFIGNPEAGLLDRRFLQADLNRVFVDGGPDTHEHRRARQLRVLLDQADVFLDLHQTILPTRQPFYIFPWSPEGADWARAVGGASSWVSRAPGQSFSEGTCCADEYVRHRGRIGFTLELGQKGLDPAQDQRAEQAVRSLLDLNEALAGGASLRRLARHSAPLSLVHTVWKQPCRDRDLRLRQGLENFQPVQAGELLSAEGCAELRAPLDGLLLFPKYPPADRPLPGELVRIVQPLPQSPERLWG
jgi:succinylglutamate desuccinylase